MANNSQPVSWMGLLKSRLWVGTHTHKQTLGDHSPFVRSASFSPDSQRLASSADDCAIKIWDIATKTAKFRKSHSAPEIFYNLLYFPADNRRLALISDRNVIRLWDIATVMTTGTCVHTPYEKGVMKSGAPYPDCQSIVPNLFNQPVRIWGINQDNSS